ncbi:hypothetical protein GGI07_004278 [Coemansia sp. Benny D115]|nr:hypothetical protein GGI07_004278 [Coemansia sp. Benny D115]
MDILFDKQRPANKSWQMGMNMEMRLWSYEENLVFHNSFTRNIILNSGQGLRLNRGILDMSALQLILKELESGEKDWMLIDELEENYPSGIWWEMMLYLAEMHGRLESHTIYEVNYKMLKTVETIIMPLNNIFYHHVTPSYMLLFQKNIHPLTDTVLKYCDFYSATSVLIKPAFGTNHFIDCFIRGMVEFHGERMLEFLRVCKDNIIFASVKYAQNQRKIPTPPPTPPSLPTRPSVQAPEEELVKAMEPREASDSPQQIKLFTPRLKTQPEFNVYDKPVSVETTSISKFSSSVSSFAFSGGSGGKSTSLLQKTNIAIAYLVQHHGIAVENIQITDAYTDTSSGITHVYARQTVGGVSVANGLANVNVDDQGQVISSSQSFVPASMLPKGAASGKRMALAGDQVGAGSLLAARAVSNVEASLKSAFKSLASHVNTSVSDAVLDSAVVAATSSAVIGGAGFSLSGLPESVAAKGQSTARQTLVQLSDGSLASSWHIVLEQPDHWWSAQVHAETGEVVALNDWVSRLEAYNVYPCSVTSPLDGQRSLVVDPANKVASPKGWVSDISTAGNNVWAQSNPSGGSTWQSNYRPSAVNGLFNFTLDLTKQPAKYLDAAIAQLFYTVNVMHDLSFAYGFDEAAGNFQAVNYGGQGVGGDFVVAFAQDGSGTNNANFATPPDGENGVMRMYTWTVTTPGRDGDFEQDIVAHEYTHGVSNRLTGGPSNTDCLYELESGGMGEGWSDAMANIMRVRTGMTRTTDMLLGEYVYGGNIRTYPYSTSMSTNPLTFKALDDPVNQEVHSVGELWAEVLYEMMWNLIDAHGIGNLYEHDLGKGNCLTLQLLLNAMKLQPCNPTFLQARDAIVQAEKNLTGGQNACALWKAFAKRGMGSQARVDKDVHHEDYTLPSGC